MMLSLSSLARTTDDPVGSRVKNRGVLPRLFVHPTRARRPDAGSTARVAMPSCPRFEA
jgi:hypothetical protein